jgi:hypothetical protein
MGMFYPKDETVRRKHDQVTRLCLPFTIVGSATAASVAITADDPAILYLKTAGVDQITAALASTETGPTYTAPSDSGGQVAALVNINEPLFKVVNVALVSRTANLVAYANVTATPSTGLVVNSAATSSKICLDLKLGVAINAANTFNGCLVVEYIPALH